MAGEDQEPEHQSRSQQRNRGVPMPLGRFIGVPTVDEHSGNADQAGISSSEVTVRSENPERRFTKVGIQ